MASLLGMQTQRQIFKGNVKTNPELKGANMVHDTFERVRSDL